MKAEGRVCSPITKVNVKYVNRLTQESLLSPCSRGLTEARRDVKRSKAVPNKAAPSRRRREVVKSRGESFQEEVGERRTKMEDLGFGPAEHSEGVDLEQMKDADRLSPKKKTQAHR